MTIFTARTNYFKALAIADPHVQHTAAFTIDGDATTRMSFIEISAEQDALNAAVCNKLQYPFVVQCGFTGGLTDRDGDIRNRYYNQLQFLTKAAVTDELPEMQDAILAAKEQTYLIMKAWLNKLFYDMENNSCEVPLKRIDANGISWKEMGPVADNFFGWELSFTDDEPALDVIDFDNAYWS